MYKVWRYEQWEKVCLLREDMEMNLSHGQEIVLRQHLADYPEDVSFEHICAMIEDGDDEVSVWVYFEEWDVNTFVEHITRLAHNIDRVIVEVKETE